MPNRAQQSEDVLGPSAPRRRRTSAARVIPAALVVLCAARAAAQTEPPAPPATPPAPPVATDGGNDYWDPPVITPTGQPSRVSESPSTTFVITGEEVRHSGATTIPEILRRVPGMDVRMLGSTDGQIGPRGFAFEVADRVLVMVDGRTVYVDFFGGTAYEMLPVSVLDIDRIEVVLGPGASVYGNKAMLGTLNIITRSAAAFPGLEARVDAGLVRPGDVRAAVRDGVVWGNWRARVTALFRRLSPYPIDNTNVNPPETEINYTDPVSAGGGTATIGYAPHPGVEFALEAGAMTGNTYLIPTGQQVYPFGSTLAYAKADGRVALGGPGSPYGDLRMKAVCNFGWIRSSAFPPSPPPPAPPNTTLNTSYQTPYAEVSHDFHYSVAGIGMQARWGGEARLNVFQDKSITIDSVPIWNVAGFANNEALLGRWRVTTGLRVDHQTLTAYTVSPRVSVVFSPTPAQQIRAAFNTGYNNPSLIQNFANLPTATGGFLMGNHGLDPERIYYGELAYGGTAASWLRLFVNTFAYRMDNSITVSQSAQWVNQAGATGYGGETGFEVAPNRTLSGYAHYAYLRLKGDAQQPYAMAGAGNLGSPTNKVTAGIRLDLPRRVYLTADGQYFGDATVARLNDLSTPLYLATPIHGYLMLHARTGIVLDNAFDLSIAATNLLDQKEAQLLGAQNPRLRVMATIAYTP